MQKKSSRAVVIGAGPGGLAAAILLAKSGVKVTVVEKRSDVGGRTSTIEQDGFRFDIGPTFFLYPQVLREIFAAAGYDLDREVPMTRLDPQYRLVFGAGGELLATPNVERMERAIAAISPEDADALPPLPHAQPQQAREVPALPAIALRELARPRQARDAQAASPPRALEVPRHRPADALQGRAHPPRLQLPVQVPRHVALPLPQSSSPSSPSSSTSTASSTPSAAAAPSPRPWPASPTELGVEILLDEPVEQHRHRTRQAPSASAPRNRSLPADAVVVNADFAGAMRRMVPNAQRKQVDRRTHRKQAILLLHLHDVSRHRRPLRRRLAPHHLPGRELPARTSATSRSATPLSDDPSFYVQNACVTDPTLAPQGQSTLYVLLPVTHETGSIDWAEETPRFRALALQQLEKIGIHDVEARIRTEQHRHPSRLGDGVRPLQGRDVLHGPLARPDAAPAPPQPLRRRRQHVPRRRRHPPRQRPARHLRVRPHHLPPAARRPAASSRSGTPRPVSSPGSPTNSSGRHPEHACERSRRPRAEHSSRTLDEPAPAPRLRWSAQPISASRSRILQDAPAIASPA